MDRGTKVLLGVLLTIAVLVPLVSITRGGGGGRGGFGGGGRGSARGGHSFGGGSRSFSGGGRGFGGGRSVGSSRSGRAGSTNRSSGVGRSSSIGRIGHTGSTRGASGARHSGSHFAHRGNRGNWNRGRHGYYRRGLYGHNWGGAGWGWWGYNPLWWGLAAVPFTAAIWWNWPRERFYNYYDDSVAFVNDSDDETVVVYSGGTPEIEVGPGEKAYMPSGQSIVIRRADGSAVKTEPIKENITLRSAQAEPIQEKRLPQRNR
ncbi:hypothetical protein JST99_04100 [Candidatus Dependentiae bacterium]|nr:hypothetical protein [Candidatus Dependentiae bacterium]MCC7415397.1 hypothetical protein [Campylobacterota bacterium]